MSDLPDLSTLAMIGEMSKPIFDQLDIHPGDAFSESLRTQYPDTPADVRVANAMAAAQDEIFKKAPVWMRINSLSHKIAHARNSGTPEKDLDWDKINKILTENTTEADFNNFDPVHSYEDWSALIMNYAAAQSDIGGWRREECKDCKQTFYLSQRELMFYLDKNLHIPKRCPACRAARKNGSNPKVYAKADDKPKNQSPKKEPTAMEIALRKAGLIE